MTVLEALGITAEHIKAWVEEQFEEQLADVQFNKISINSISNQINDAGSFTQTRYIEIGSTVNKVTIRWELNKTPTSQDINGTEIDANERSKTFTFDDGLRTTQSFRLSVADGRGAATPQSTSVNFVNGRYYGALEHGCTIDSDVIKGLTKQLQSDSNRSVNFTVSPEGKRPVYALPSRLPAPIFKINTLEYDWIRIEKEYLFTNDSGHTEPYDVWMHPQDVPGTITVNVT